MERVEGLRKITSYEAYIETKQRLEDYLKQYKWIIEAKEPYQDIKNMLVKCVENRKEYEKKSTDEKTEATPQERAEKRKLELDNENKILALKLQYEALKGDTYVGNLRRNITALFVTIGEYEARIESAQRKEKKDNEGKQGDFLTSRSMRRFRFFLAKLTGMVPGEINMNVENRKEIPLYIIENYDLVNKPEITPEHKEMALVVVPEVDTSVGIFHRLVEQPVNAFIASRGIVEKGINSQISSEKVVAEKSTDTQAIETEQDHLVSKEHHVEQHHKKAKDDNDINI